MRIAITGATGLVGSALCRTLSPDHRVVRLVRTSTSDAESVAWDPVTGRLDLAPNAGIDAVVHLAGENIAAGRWTPQQKRRIRDSRVHGTRLLSGALAQLEPRPRVLVCASATGWYGDRGDEILTEDSPPGAGFLAEVSREWEQAADPARQAGIRVVHLRFGIVLSAHGGALVKMLPPFRLGLGGPLGDGRQYWSWIGIDDATGICRFALESDALAGPVNAVAPDAPTNLDFTRALGRVLSRPTLMAVPAFAVRLLFGEMGEALLLASARVEPGKLHAAKFRFQQPRLEDALRRTLTADAA